MNNLQQFTLNDTYFEVVGKASSAVCAVGKLCYTCNARDLSITRLFGGI